MKFWTIQGRNLRYVAGIFENMKPSAYESQISIICSNFQNSQPFYITGGANGNITTWQTNTGLKVLKAHEGRVNCLVQKANLLLSGG